MQMLLACNGAGIGIPKTNLQIATNTTKIYLRHGANDPKIVRLIVDDRLCVGGKSGVFAYAFILTEWFDLTPGMDKWALNPIALIGKKVRINVSGVLPNPTDMTVDIVITLFDKYGDATEVLNKCCVKVDKGLQFADSRITGIIQESER